MGFDSGLEFILGNKLDAKKRCPVAYMADKPGKAFGRV